MSNLEKERVYGVYINKKNGNLAHAEQAMGRYDFCIDKNLKKRNLLGMLINMSEFGTGNYFFNKSLRNYEYLGKL